MTDKILDKKPILEQIKIRWKSETNKFWKKVLKIATIIGSSAAGILLANTTFGLEQYVAPIIFAVCGYVLVFCGATGLMAKLTKA